MKHKLLFFLFSIFLLLEGNAQCAMCRAVLESEESQTAAEAINDGIVYLMAIPYLLVGGLIFFIYKKYSTLKK
ncbi:membrane protein [Tamlana nanhaiensis]|uniref:Membrane protein n=1 Tax=Neotamlana nanhaiensis TaxID=1382798 RepID=A0A0D7W0A1_9FLAO|nr:membrane protein [Tamlana nanhaiensis]KJD32459.1 membrane protein [Tamlana nanhaiensis]